MTRPVALVAAGCCIALALTACGGPSGGGRHALAAVGHSGAEPAGSHPATTTTTTTVPPTTTTTTTTVPPTTTTTTVPPTTTTTVPPTTTTTTTTVPPTTTTTTTPGCSPTLAGRLASTGSATQLIVVDAPSYSTTIAQLTAYGRQGACWVPIFGPWTAYIGYGGFSDHKVEGDGTTPTGAYGIGATMYGNAPDPGVHYAYHQLVCGDWWDEDPSSPQYNTFQHVPCGQAPPFGGDSEALWQETTAYPSFAVIDYNTGPVVAGAGSAIFVHADVGGPTAGCVSLPLGDLDQLLDWLVPAASPLVVMGPATEIARF